MKKIILLYSFLLLTINIIGQLNPTDACGAGVQTLSVNGSCTTNNYMLDGSFSDNGQVVASCATGGNDRDDGWYKFVATTTSTTIDVTGDKARVVAVFTGCGTGEIACAQAGAGTATTTTFSTTIGVTYYIQIHRRSGNNGATMTGTICIYTVSSGGGCLTATNGQWPSSTYSPLCNGSTENITTCGFASEYSMVNVVAGTTYTFSSSIATDIITISNNTGTTVLVTGTGSLVWTSTITGTVRFYTHLTGCAAQSACRNRSVFCGVAPPPSGNQDCSVATQICNDQSFVGNSSGFSNQELNIGNQGCMTTEHQSSWYIFQVASSGTLALNITTAVDYDFAIWGPNVTCNSLGTPIRCSWSASSGNTGLGNGAVDNSEGAGGNAWVAPLNVTTGQTYMMLIDNFSSNSTAFTLDWTMTGGASLNCTPLPIELLTFTVENIDNENVINWVTVSERDNDYFTLEHSLDGSNWNILSKLDGGGTNNSGNMYEYIHEGYPRTINYYRLKQTDYNGDSEIFNTIVINNELKQKDVIKRINQLGQEVDENATGLIIEFYSDGTSNKVIK